MSSLRDIVRRNVEAETLNKLSGLSQNEREIVLDMYRREGHFDKKVQQILDAYLIEIEENSTSRKRRKIWKVAFSAITIFFTVMIGYTVNTESWTIVWPLAGLQVAFSLIYIFLVEE